ncbi:MAG TPA: hypothetical protein VJN89_09660 [Candidatus Acidoferrum sp.]|nr:hypothetical protein [Candidatus Acidoferrum sp.]
MKERPDDLSPEERELLGERVSSLEALRAHHADCPQIEMLLASRAGVLPEAASQSVARHVEACGFCRILLKELNDEEFSSAGADEMRRVRERVLATVVGREEKQRRTGGGLRGAWLWKAIPATVLAAAVVSFFVWMRMRPPARLAPAPAPGALQAQNPPTASVLVWEKLPIKLQAESVLVVRGAPRTNLERYAAAVTSALAFYRDDDYADAAKNLGEVAKQFPRGVEGQLYLGITQLKLGENAISALRSAQELGPEQFRDDATWYLALAYESQGDAQNAVAELQKLCAGKSVVYSERACTGIHELRGKGDSR